MQAAEILIGHLYLGHAIIWRLEIAKIELFQPRGYQNFARD